MSLAMHQMICNLAIASKFKVLEDTEWLCKILSLNRRFSASD